MYPAQERHGLSTIQPYPATRTSLHRPSNATRAVRQTANLSTEQRLWCHIRFGVLACAYAVPGAHCMAGDIREGTRLCDELRVCRWPLFRGQAIGERKAQTQARVQVEEASSSVSRLKHLRRGWRVRSKGIRVRATFVYIGRERRITGRIRAAMMPIGEPGRIRHP